MIQPDLELRLAAHTEALARSLYPTALTDGNRLILGDGLCVVTSGLRKGWVTVGEERRTLIELVAIRYECDLKTAAGECEDWLECVAAFGEGSEEETGPTEVMPTDRLPGSMERGLPPDPEPVAEPEERRVVPFEPPKKLLPPDVHRMLPQSPDAEKGLVCSLMLDPYKVARVCAEKGVTKKQFHVPHLAEIFDALTYLAGEKMLAGDGSDFIPLTEFLRDTKRLEQCGGPAGITELFTFLPTAANVAYYVEVVQQKHELRQVIALGTSIAARCYEEQDQLALLLAELGAGVAEIGKHRGQLSFVDMMLSRAFDVVPPPEPPAVFTLGEAVIATPENILMIQAKVKAGKSALIGALIAATMCELGWTGDCLGITSTNPRGLAVIHFDTEQSKYHHHLVIGRALRRAGRRQLPPWLHSYYLKGLSVAGLKSALATELERRAKEHGGIHCVILDGIGDFCADVNDAAEANALVAEIEALAVKYHTVIVCVLHENPGTDIGKTRGHLGSHFARKAETNLRLEKDADGVTVVFSDSSRTLHIGKDKGIRFAWNDEAQMHTLTEASFTPAGRTKKEAGELRVNARVTMAKAKLGRFFAQAATVRRALLLSASKLPEGSFDKYWVELKHGSWIVQNAAVKSMWQASPEWAAELAGDYPEGDEG